MPLLPGHVFYDRLQTVLIHAGFKRVGEVAGFLCATTELIALGAMAAIASHPRPAVVI